MSEIHTWDTTAANNNDPAPNGWPEGMNYSQVNNAARENMAAAAKLYADSNGTLSTAGSSNTYTLTPNRTVAAYASGLGFTFQANHSSTGAATLNVSALGAKDLKSADGSALASGDIVSGQYYKVIYQGTYFLLFPQLTPGDSSYEPADATILKDADIGVTVQAYDSTIVVDADIGVTVQGYDSDTAKLDVAQSFTAAQTFKELTDTVYAISGTTPAIDPANGAVQTWTLTGNSTPTFAGFATGQMVEVWVEDGTAYTLALTNIDELRGGAMGALPTTGPKRIVFEKVGSTMRASDDGDYS